MKIDFIYVINLATDSNKIYNNIQNLKFKDDIGFYEFPAVNGWDLVQNKIDSPYQFKQADWWKKDFGSKHPQNDWWSRDLTPGEIGCALSHYQVIEGAYNSGYENVLILEEDFYLNKEFSKFPVFELNHLDDDWSICYLGRSPSHRLGSNLLRRSHLCRTRSCSSWPDPTDRPVRKNHTSEDVAGKCSCCRPASQRLNIFCCP